MNRDIIDRDIFDSRDVIERISDLEAQDSEDDGSGLDDFERGELDALERFAEDASSVADWEYGETFIRGSYFEEYAEQLADDIGAIDGNASWPLNHIDWKAAAEDLLQDYSEFQLDGITYYARS